MLRRRANYLKDPWIHCHLYMRLYDQCKLYNLVCGTTSHCKSHVINILDILIYLFKTPGSTQHHNIFVRCCHLVTIRHIRVNYAPIQIRLWLTEQLSKLLACVTMSDYSCHWVVNCHLGVEGERRDVSVWLTFPNMACLERVGEASYCCVPWVALSVSFF